MWRISLNVQEGLRGLALRKCLGGSPSERPTWWQTPARSERAPLGVAAKLAPLSLGFRTSACAGLCIHAPMAPPRFQGSVGGGTSCAERISWMLPKKPSKLGFRQNPSPAVGITGYHPNYFLLGFRATPSIPTSKRSSSKRGRRAFRGLCGPLKPAEAPGFFRVCKGLRGLQDLPASVASKNLQRPPSVSDHPSNGWEREFRV